MQKGWKNAVTGIMVGILCLLGTASSGMALDVAGNVSSNVITILKQAGADPVKLVMSEQCTEPAAGGGTKFCLCQGVAFRIAQILAETVWRDGAFHSWDVDVETGWNTDGPEEFFEDAAGVHSLAYAANATPDKNLTLADSWYRITVLSTGKTYSFRGTSAIYPENFLELRSKYKNGTATEEEITAMQALRKQIVQFMTALPFASQAFAVEVSQGAVSGSGGGSGGCSLGSFSWGGMLFLAVPGMFFLLKK